jgi:hypothetical protein
MISDVHCSIREAEDALWHLRRERLNCRIWFQGCRFACPLEWTLHALKPAGYLHHASTSHLLVTFFDACAMHASLALSTITSSSSVATR